MKDIVNSNFLDEEVNRLSAILIDYRKPQNVDLFLAECEADYKQHEDDNRIIGISLTEHLEHCSEVYFDKVQEIETLLEIVKKKAFKYVDRSNIPLH